MTFWPRTCAFAFAVSFQLIGGAWAADEFTRDITTRTVVVGVKEAPPFSMKEADGTFSAKEIDPETLRG